MSDSSSDEDYRKMNRKAKKSQVRNVVPNFDSNSMAKDFAQKLLKERGFDITEEEMGFKKQNKQQKNTTYVHSIDQCSFKELQKEFNKCENVGQICNILKALSTHKEAESKQQLYYKILRCEFLIRNRQFEESKFECLQLLQEDLNILQKVRILLALSRAQLDTGEIYNAFMQALRVKSFSDFIKFMPTQQNQSIYDSTPEQLYQQINDTYQNTNFRISRDNKKTLTLIGVQGNSATGCLGQGELTQCSELTQLTTLKNRAILSIACGEHHIIILVSGCSCINPYGIHQCKGETCNGGNEVFSWGENFLGQVTMSEKDGNFINTPYNIHQLSGKKIIGVSAFRCTSIAWDTNGQIYQWGAKHPVKFEAIPNISHIQFGEKFVCILSQKILYVIGEITQQIQFPQLTKLDNSVEQISCGSNHLIALNSEGLVFGVGSNEKKQLGTQNHMKYSQIYDEECFYIYANENSTVMVTVDGEVLYCGEITQGKIIDYPKTLQIDDDVQIIQASSYSGQIYALNLQGKVFKWDLEKEPKAKLLFSAPIRQIHLCRGIRLCETTSLQGEWCRVELEDESEDTNQQFETFSDINIIINLGDKYGPYGIKQTHPIRYNLFITDNEEITKEQINSLSQKISAQKINNQQDNKIYLNFLNDIKLSKAEINPTEDSAKHKLILQLQEPNNYYVYLYLNESLLIDCPLQLNLIAGSKQQELLQEQENKRQELQAEQDRKKALLQKKQQEEQEKKLLLEEQEQQQIQRQIETKKRAEDALLLHQQKVKEEQKQKEEERQQKKDLLTGGGFDINKVKQRESIQSQQQQTKIIKSINPVQAQKVKQQIQAIQQQQKQQQQTQQQQQQAKQQKLNPVKVTPKALQSISNPKTADKAFSTQDTFKEFNQTGQFRKTDTQLQKIQSELQQEYLQLKKQETQKYKR